MQKVGIAFVLVLAACAGEPQGPAGDPATGAIDALIAARRFRAALAEVDSRLVPAPGDVVLLDRRVRVLRELGLEHQACAAALELRRIAPSDARFAYEAGELAAYLGETAAAHEQFAAARALDPADWRPAVGEAALLLAEKSPRLAEAEALLKPWVDGPGARVEARFHHALVVEAKGDAQGALAVFERALELDPRHVASLCNAARLAEAAGERPRALDLLRRASSTVALDDEPLHRELERRIAALAAPPPR